MRVDGLLQLAAAALIVGVASACATTQARTSSAGAPLEIPDPPPRLVALPAEPIVSDEPPSITEETKPVQPAPTTAPAEPPARATAKPAPQDKPPAPSNAAEASGAAPRPGLRPAGGEALTVRTVRESLDRARRQIESLQPDKLSTADRAQFDTARRFLDLASPALTAGNAVFAQYLVEKAETLIRPLKP